MELQNIPTPENTDLNAGATQIDQTEGAGAIEDTGAIVDAEVVEDKTVATIKYDICNVEAIRKDGNPKIVALKIVSIEKQLMLTDDQFASLYSFDIHHFGQRAFLAGTRKAGDIQEL